MVSELEVEDLLQEGSILYFTPPGIADCSSSSSRGLLEALWLAEKGL